MVSCSPLERPFGLHMIACVRWLPSVSLPAPWPLWLLLVPCLSSISEFAYASIPSLLTPGEILSNCEVIMCQEITLLLSYMGVSFWFIQHPIPQIPPLLHLRIKIMLLQSQDKIPRNTEVELLDMSICLCFTNKMINLITEKFPKVSSREWSWGSWTRIVIKILCSTFAFLVMT